MDSLVKDEKTNPKDRDDVEFDEIISILEGMSKPTKILVREALKLIADSAQSGNLTETEAQLLLKEVASVAITNQMSKYISRYPLFDICDQRIHKNRSSALSAVRLLSLQGAHYR